jgi:transposase
MLAVGNCRIFLYGRPVDMRKSFEGLSALVDYEFNGQLLSPSYFIFMNKRRNMVKILYWDRDGLAIWYKRLEKGTFRKFNHQSSEIDRRTLSLLLEGIEPKRLRHRFSIN